METYLGLKTLKAEPMNLGDYNIHRGWNIPEDEDPKKEGYLVEYTGGYQSWSPKETFEESYKKTSRLSFDTGCTTIEVGGALWINLQL